MESASQPIEYRWLGQVGYDEAHALQRRIVEERVEERGADTFLALEHEPVTALRLCVNRAASDLVLDL